MGMNPPMVRHVGGVIESNDRPEVDSSGEHVTAARGCIGGQDQRLHPRIRDPVQPPGVGAAAPGERGAQPQRTSAYWPSCTRAW